MAKHTLENNFEFDFLLFGIICHESEYRICSAINKCLGLDLARDKALELKNKKQAEALTFSVFTFTDENSENEYVLLNNLSSNAAQTEVKAKPTVQAGLFDDSGEGVNEKKGRLIPEQDETDFFLLLRGDFSSNEKNNILKKLNALETIINIKEIDPKKLNSKNNLLF